MSGFSLEVHHQQYLPEHGTDVDAIVAVTARGTAPAAGGTAHVVLVDASGSMGSPPDKLRAARRATLAALDALPDGALVAVVAGRHDARMIYPEREELVALDASARREAAGAVAALTPSGGTAIGTWLTLARTLLAPHADRVRHAVLLTDGRDEHEDPADLAAAIAAARGVFTCDARGVGTHWVVDEVRAVATGLLGSADIVHPESLAGDLAAVVAAAARRALDDVDLRVWTPRGAEVRGLTQVSPSLLDLAGRREPDPASDLVGHHRTGAWSDETREYHLRVRLPARPAGEELLAARVAVLVADEVVAETGVRVEWTADAARSSPVEPRVAHWTGQAELAAAIREGLEARRARDAPRATARLGRAVALAVAVGHHETAALLSRVVEVEDPATGRVRLRDDVSEEDEMTLDVRATHTVRLRG